MLKEYMEKPVAKATTYAHSSCITGCKNIRTKEGLQDLTSRKQTEGLSM
jgi:hypothetical protein